MQRIALSSMRPGLGSARALRALLAPSAVARASLHSCSQHKVKATSPDQAGPVTPGTGPVHSNFPADQAPVDLSKPYQQRAAQAPDYSKGPSALDKAAHLFFFTEIMRGMWVVLEQFFRPP